MNINQQQICLTSLDEIMAIDIAELIMAVHPDETNISKIVISKYKAPEFISLMKRMLAQLKQELTKGLGLLLPNAENYQNDYGSIDLSNEIGAFKIYLERNQFVDMEGLLEKFIHYQVKNGFWDKRVIYSTEIEIKQIEDQYNLIEINEKALTNNLQKFDVLVEQFNQKNIEITSNIEAKKNELDQIAQNLQTAITQVAEINTHLSNANNKDTEISGILQNLKDKVTAIETDITNYKEAFEIIETNWEELEKEFNKNISSAKSNFEKTKEHIEFTESRRDLIEKLTGMAADSALGTKFNQRETKLVNGIQFWKWAIPLMTILSIFWVIAVFNWYPAKFKNEWVSLGVNLLKTTPAFILLGFVFKQYTKERNLEEEYAFKSAVAMTLTAYSNMLSEKDIERNDSRQKMLLSSIEQLYQQPRIHEEKSEMMFSFKSRHIKESIDSLKQSIANLKGE